MINALRKELSLENIEKMDLVGLQNEIGGIQEIIFDEYLDGLPENYDAGEYYLDCPEYNTLVAIETDLLGAMKKL